MNFMMSYYHLLLASDRIVYPHYFRNRIESIAAEMGGQSSIDFADNLRPFENHAGDHLDEARPAADGGICIIG